MVRFRLLFLLNGAAVAVFAPFASVILAERGFSVAAIGLIVALSSAGYVLAVSAWGHFGDVVLGRGRALRYAMLLSAALMVVFLLPLSPVAVGIAYVAYAACFGAAGPLSDALAVNGLRDPGRQYGALRALSSAAFTVTTVAVGLLYGGLGYWPAGLLVIGISILVASLAGTVPDLDRATLSSHRRGGAIREALVIQPALAKILLAVGMAFVGIFTGFTFLSLRLVELGGGPPQVGLSSAVAAGSEVVAMIVAGRIIGRTGIRLLFVVSALLSAVAFAGWAVLASPEAIIASRVVSGFGYSGLWIASVMTIQLLLPARLQGSGQALIAMTTAGLAAFVANVIGGLIYATVGHAALFAIGAAFAIAGAALGWLWMPRRGAGRFTEPVRPREAEQLTRPVEARHEPAS
jgi:PPP family 3-phenylpropionic acid transporter